MEKIGAQNYNYNDIKVTLENVKFNINENLSAIGENVDTVGLFEKIKHWFANLGGGADTGILEQTDESALGSDAVVNATIGENVDTVGLFEKIKHWFANLGGGADTGILEQTDESALGSDAVVNATQDKVEEAANAALDKAGDLAISKSSC